MAKPNPALRVVEKFGGAETLAAALKIDVSAVRRWTYERPRGRGGVIPHWHHGKILALAKKRRIPLKPDDFFRAA